MIIISDDFIEKNVKAFVEKIIFGPNFPCLKSLKFIGCQYGDLIIENICKFVKKISKYRKIGKFDKYRDF